MTGDRETVAPNRAPWVTQSLRAEVRPVLVKLSMRLPCSPAIPLRRVQPRAMTAFPWRDLYEASMAVVTAKRMEVRLWNGILTSNVKNKFWNTKQCGRTFKTLCRVKDDLRKSTYCVIPFIWSSKTGKTNYGWRKKYLNSSCLWGCGMQGESWRNVRNLWEYSVSW